MIENFAIKNLKNEVILNLSTIFTVKPKEILTSFSYFDKKIDSTKEFLLEFFGKDVYQALLINEDKLKTKHGIDKFFFLKCLDKGYNDFIQIQKNAQNLLKRKGQDNKENDFLYYIIVMILQQKKNI